MLNWLDRMSEKRMTKEIYKANACRQVVHGSPWRTFFHQIGDVLKRKGTQKRRSYRVINVEEAHQFSKNRSKWRFVFCPYADGKNVWVYVMYISELLAVLDTAGHIRQTLMDNLFKLSLISTFTRNFVPIYPNTVYEKSYNAVRYILWVLRILTKQKEPVPLFVLQYRSRNKGNIVYPHLYIQVHVH